MQSLLYKRPSTWNKLPNILKTTKILNCFKHDIKKHFLWKLSDTEVDIYRHFQTKTLTVTAEPG